MASTTPIFFGPAEPQYLTRSVATSKKAPQEQFAPCVRTALNITTVSKAPGARTKVKPYQIVKHPALKFTLHRTEVKTVKKFVPACEKGPAIKFTLHLKSVKTVTRYLPAEEVKVKVEQ